MGGCGGAACYWRKFCVSKLVRFDGNNSSVEPVS